MNLSLLYSHLNLQLRRKERSSVSVILVANLLIKTKHLGIRGESLNLVVIFTYQNDFAAQVFLLFLKYIFPVVTCFRFSHVEQKEPMVKSELPLLFCVSESRVSVKLPAAGNIKL